MEDAEKVLTGKRHRIIALVTEEPDADLLHIILALLTEARLMRAEKE